MTQWRILISGCTCPDIEKSSRRNWSPLHLILMCVLQLSHFRTGSSCGGAIGWQRLPVRKTPGDSWLIMHDTKNVCVCPQIWLGGGSISSFLSFRKLIHWTGVDRGVAVVSVCGRGWPGVKRSDCGIWLCRKPLDQPGSGWQPHHIQPVQWVLS